jgi:hypothetical protein
MPPGSTLAHKGETALKLRQIVEAAAYVSAHSRKFIEHPDACHEPALTEFWLLSRQRLHDWMSAADELLLGRVAGPRRANPDEATLISLLQESFAGELLARVWSATLSAADQHSTTLRHEPLVRQVFVGHLQVRHRALCLLAEGRSVAGDAARLDQFRRRCERWTDVLLGHLVCRFAVEQFAFDADRARDFGQTQRIHGEVSPQHAVWELILSGLAVSFPDALTLTGRQAERSRGLAQAALAMFTEGRAGAELPGNVRSVTSA